MCYMSICSRYACMILVIVMHSRLNMPCEVMVCSLGHHGAIGSYDVNVLAEIEQEIHIIIIRLHH